MMDQKDFEMANGKYSSDSATDWRNDPYYFSAVNLDRDVPDWDEEEEDEEDEEQDDLEDDTHDGGSHEESEGDDDWRGFDEDDD